MTLITQSSQRLLVLDIDDTLILERDYVWSGFLACERKSAIPFLASTCFDLFEQGVRGDTFDRALVKLGRPPDEWVVRRLIAIYRAHEPCLSLQPDVADWLATRPSDISCACVTDGPALSQQAKARRLGLSDWCDPIIFTDLLGKGFSKPHPKAFSMVTLGTGISPTDTTYIADNPAKDFTAPHALGWRTIRIRREGALHAGLDSPRYIDGEVTSFRDLMSR